MYNTSISEASAKYLQALKLNTKTLKIKHVQKHGKHENKCHPNRPARPTRSTSHCSTWLTSPFSSCCFNLTAVSRWSCKTYIYTGNLLFTNYIFGGWCHIGPHTIHQTIQRPPHIEKPHGSCSCIHHGLWMMVDATLWFGWPKTARVIKSDSTPSCTNLNSRHGTAVN